MVTTQEMIDLIKRLPDVESHLFIDNGRHVATQEWLCGGFAGRAFEGDTQEEAVSQLIEYLYLHIGHDGIVGLCVTKSGFPDLKRVYDYCKPQEQMAE